MENEQSKDQPQTNDQSDSPKRKLWIYITSAIILVLLFGYFLRSLQPETDDVEIRQASVQQEIPVMTQIPEKSPNKTTILSLVHADGKNSAIKKAGDTFTIDLMIDPGRNVISYMKLELLYDPVKLAPDGENAFQPEKIFPSVLEKPVYTPGKITVTLSVGPYPEKAINSPVKAASISFKTLGITEVDIPTVVTPGSETQVLSIAPNDNTSENVISAINPAEITIE